MTVQPPDAARPPAPATDLFADENLTAWLVMFIDPVRRTPHERAGLRQVCSASRAADGGLWAAGHRGDVRVRRHQHGHPVTGSCGEDNSGCSPSAAGYEITSDFSLEYNRIAWAAGDISRWWWPVADDHWPIDDASTTVDSFRRAFAAIGYEEADDDSLEPGYEKVALFAKEGRVTHAARQLTTGRWTSKLGSDVDIEHDLRSIEGQVYGTVVSVLKRPLGTTSPDHA